MRTKVATDLLSPLRSHSALRPGGGRASGVAFLGGLLYAGSAGVLDSGTVSAPERSSVEPSGAVVIVKGALTL